MNRAIPATKAIFESSPHRVFVTRIGRAEVYQAIPPADGRSPDGPHTHLLPKILRSGRTHPATAPVPWDWTPCIHLYPANPRKDVFGSVKPFNRAEYETFQNALSLFGDPKLLELKGQVVDAVGAGDRPEALSAPKSRFAKGVIRVALRRLRACDGSSPVLSRWRDMYDSAETAQEHEGS